MPQAATSGAETTSGASAAFQRAFRGKIFCCKPATQLPESRNFATFCDTLRRNATLCEMQSIYARIGQKRHLGLYICNEVKRSATSCNDLQLSPLGVTLRCTPALRPFPWRILSQ